MKRSLCLLVGCSALLSLASCKPAEQLSAKDAKKVDGQQKAIFQQQYAGRQGGQRPGGQPNNAPR